MSMYDFNAKGVVTQQEMKDLLLRINNCKHCNNGAFSLSLKKFYYDEEQDMGIGLVKASYNKKVNIDTRLWGMMDCEFCHYEIDYMCVTPTGQL